MFDRLSERRGRFHTALFVVALHGGVFGGALALGEVAFPPPPARVPELQESRVPRLYPPRPLAPPSKNSASASAPRRRAERRAAPVLAALPSAPSQQPAPPVEAEEPEQPQRPQLKWLVDTIYVPSSVRVEPPERSAACKAPAMPEQARIFGIDGEVRARYVVNQDGSVGQFTVVNQAPAVLAFAVQSWLERCPHIPARVSGEPISVQVETPFFFKLK